MANLPSAEKRHRQNERNRLRNRARRRVVKSATRKFLDALAASDQSAAQAQFIVVTKKLDQTAAKGTIHRNTAARRKSRLARRLNALKAPRTA